MIDRRGHRPVPVAPLLFLLAAGVVAACGTPTPSTVTPPPNATTGPSTGPLTAPPASPTAAPVTPAPATPAPTIASAETPPCEAADLKASHGLVEGAAGSRLTQVVLVTAVPCSVDAFPTLGFRDAGGAAILGGVAGGAGTIDLSPDASYSSDVRISNFCADDPEFPLTMVIRLASGEVDATPAFDDASDLPPCNGGGGATLEAGAWTAGT